MGAVSPQRQSGMEACGDGATNGSPRKHISRHRFAVRTMSGQPVQARVQARPKNNVTLIDCKRHKINKKTAA